MKFEVECDSVRVDKDRNNIYVDMVFTTNDGTTFVEIRGKVTSESELPEPGDKFYLAISKKVTLLPVLTDVAPQAE